jgi:serine/threonine protein kinase
MFACRWLKGGSVEDLVGKGSQEAGGRWTAQEVKPLLRSVAAALEGLHAAGIAHCDLKEASCWRSRATSAPPRSLTWAVSVRMVSHPALCECRHSTSFCIQFGCHRPNLRCEGEAASDSTLLNAMV